MFWITMYVTVSLFVILIIRIHKKQPKVKWLKNFAIWLVFQERDLANLIKSKIKKIRFR